MRHTPEIRLQAARNTLDRAYEACAHWDFESGLQEPSGGFSECCYRVDDAQRELANARKLITRLRR